MPASGLKTADYLIKENESNVRYENTIKRTNPHLAISKMNKDYGFTTDVRLFRRQIGNPISKLTNESQDLADFQVQYHNSIQEHHTVELLKARKLGATETVITGFAENAFDRYTGHDVMIIGGNNSLISGEILMRYDELFHDKTQKDGKYAFRHVEPELLDAGYTWDEAWSKGTKYYYNDIIASTRFGTNAMVRHTNDTRFMAFAASRQEKAQTFRGADDVIAAFLTEASHTGMKNDQPIMTALEPNLAQRDDGDLILETTGNGRRGFFYEYWMQTMDQLSQLFDIPINDHQRLVDTLHQKMQQHEMVGIDIDWYPLMYDYTIGIQENILSEKYINKQKRNPKLDFAQEYQCFDKETEVLTDQGFKLFKDLNKTENIASLNTDTLQLEYVKPIAYLKRKSEYLISFQNKWCNLKVTPNHRMLVHKRGGYYKGKKYLSRFDFIDAEKCKKHNEFYRCARWEGNSPKYIEIEDIHIQTETYCKMMGYYLSEGSTIHITNGNRNCWRTDITQYKDNSRLLMFKDLSKLPFKLKLGKNVITLREKKICKYLKQFGYSHEKYVPNTIKNLSPKHIRIFLDAFLLGDGTLQSQKIHHKEFGKKKFQVQKIHYTSSKRMTDDLSECILKVEKVPSAHISSKKGTSSHNGKYKSNYDVYSVHEGSKKHAKLMTMDIIKEKYNDNVYCVELPKNNTLYVRRKGQCVWSGNCKFTSTYTQAIPLEDINYLDPSAPDYEKPLDYGSLLTDRDY